MDVLWTLQTLLPAPKFGGCIEFNTEEEYNALRWEDERTKPTWAALTSAWPAAQLTITPLPVVLSQTLAGAAQALGAQQIVLTSDEVDLITNVSVQLRDLALWAPDYIYKQRATELISGMPAMRAELEQVRQLLLSRIPV